MNEKVARLENGEDADAGPAGASDGAALEPRRVGAGAGRPDPVATLQRAGRVAAAGAGADPVRPDAGVAVHVLSGRGGGDGRRPRRRRRPRGSWCRPAATRTSRTSAGSPRPIGSWCSGPTTSTRRCPGRGSGTSSGWRRASRSPAATSTCRPSRRGAIVERAVREYREGDARVRRGEHARRLVRAAGRRRADRALRHQARRRRPRALHPDVREGAAQDQRPGRAQADRAGRRQAPLHERAAAADAAARAPRCRSPRRA